MAKVCPNCDKAHKSKECPSVEPTTLVQRKLQWFDGIVVLIAIITIYLIFTQVTVPYVIEEKYFVQERYEEKEPYTELEEYTIQIPYNITQYIMEYEEKIPTQKVTKERCYMQDVPYIINYQPGLQDSFNYFTETGYRWGNTMWGFSGQYEQMIEICRPPTRMQDTEVNSQFRATFDECHYYGDTKVDCDSQMYTFGGMQNGRYTKILDFETLERAGYRGTYSKQGANVMCAKRRVVWKTAYDEKKSIRLEPVYLPQERICDYDEVEEKVNPYTEPGQYAIKEYTPVEKEVTKTLYKNETRTKEIKKTRILEKFRDIEKVKYLTKYRTLWEDLRIEYKF